MESAPAVFAGTTFVLFGSALLLWTGACALRGAPVVLGVNSTRSTVFVVLFGVAFLALGGWCFARV